MADDAAATLAPEALGPTVQAGRAGSARSLTDSTAARLRHMIVDHHLPPGTRLREQALSEAFGVSRTPLREAFKILAGEGLVDLLPNRGARVARVSLQQIEETFQVLAAAEGLAGELAAAKATEAEVAEVRALHYAMVAHYQRGDREAYFRLNQAIHKAIVAIAANTVLAQWHSSLNDRVRWARFSANMPPERWRKALAEHEEILGALARRDGAALAGLLRGHLMNKYRTIRDAPPDGVA
jgi:DNA-binding GntR family transcriptional regulator